MDSVIAQHPIGGLGSPEEIANTFLFLASDDASFITATKLSVDGGLIAW
ncbi:SDR family oxidoreductase [Leeuwenhoekiella marinoflava]